MHHHSSLAWALDALEAQIRQLERRAGRAAHGVRLAVPCEPADLLAQLQARVPNVDFELEQRSGPARVQSVSFVSELP